MSDHIYIVECETNHIAVAWSRNQYPAGQLAIALEKEAKELKERYAAWLRENPIPNIAYPQGPVIKHFKAAYAFIGGLRESASIELVRCFSAGWFGPEGMTVPSFQVKTLQAVRS